MTINPELDFVMSSFGLSDTTIQDLVARFGELKCQQHATYTFWQHSKGRVSNPAGWFVSSLRGDWGAPRDLPAGWLPQVMTFRVDETTFAQIEREVKAESA